MQNKNNAPANLQEGFYKGIFSKFVCVTEIDKFTYEESKYVSFKIVVTHRIEDGELIKIENPFAIEKKMRYNTAEQKEIVKRAIRFVSNKEYSSPSDFAKNCKRREIGIHYETYEKNGKTLGTWNFTMERTESEDFGDE
jgi:hypothetical protein